MTRQQHAIAVCRVSTPEQLLNNSLNRQQEAVLKAAKELEVTIPQDGWWSGSVSSLRGKNVKRKDLNEMIARCKKDKRIKYVIVDEPDRFMRSIDEAAFFEVTFMKFGVTVWYASDPELNTGTLASKLLKFTKYLSAEGSNEERQRKSIDGNAKLLREGKYPFPPKPGYIRGREKSIPEIHPTRGPALQKVMIRIATRRITPSQGLIELNKSDFMKDGHSPYKMDKFRAILIEPFYAKIIHIDKQIKVHKEDALHQPLITKEQHLELVKIMSGKKKNQNGPRKNGNPEYPLSNHITCDLCIDQKNGRYVGFTHSNGKGIHFYHKYRCRACKRYITREELHTIVTNLFNPISKETEGLFMGALNMVWKQQEGQVLQDADRIKRKISIIEQAITRYVDAITDPANTLIKDDMLARIAIKKQEIADLEDEKEKLHSITDADKDEFLRFAFNFINNVGSGFLDYDLSAEYRTRCKLILFPAGFYLDAKNKVYTPQISPIYGLVNTKKDLPKLEKSLLVRVPGL